MIWPIATCLLAAALVALHFWWRRRYAAEREQCRRELRLAEEVAREQYRQFLTRQDALFDTLSEGLLLLDTGGRVQRANQACARLFRLPEVVPGRTLLETFRLLDLTKAVDGLTPDHPAASFELRLPAAEEAWLQTNVAALFDAAGARQATVLVFHDLTPFKQLERARRDFVANVSHELRTPLSLIKGYTETLLQGAREDPAVAVRFLQTIDRNAERLTRLAEDLLTLSELDSGRLPLNFQSVDLRAAVEKVLHDLRDRAAARGVTLSGSVPDLALRADAGRLDQVLCNLVENAIKYGREGGHVSVGARLDDAGLAEVAVRDDGPGIPADALERIFERFYRVDKARSREHGGTGLGLAIVKHIVQSHGGHVWAQSQRGAGSTFFFTMPLAGPDPSPGARS